MPVTCDNGAIQRCSKRPATATVTASQRCFGKTTVQEDYKWPRIPKSHSNSVINLNKQPSQVKCLSPSNKVEATDCTTYGESFVRFTIPSLMKAPAVRVDRAVELPKEEKTTSYREMHRPVMRAICHHEVERVLPIKPPETKLERNSFQGTSEYREAFSKKEEVFEPSSTYVPHVCTIPFRGTSTMRADYTYKRGVPRSPQPRAKAQLTPETRSFLTTYRSSHGRPPYPKVTSFALCIRPWAFKST